MLFSARRSSPVTLMQVLPSVERTLSQWARQSPIMAASRSWTPRSYSLGALVRVELNAGKVLP